MTIKANPPEDADLKPEDRDGREEPEYSYPALKLQQNGHVIYFTTIPIDDLFPYTFVERYCENPEEGYQRKFDERRANEIAEYLSTEGESIPINIVLSAQLIADLTYTRKTKQLSYQRVPDGFAVLDGQHRLWGYQKCRIRHRVPVAIYEGLDQATDARLFVDINNKHKGVPKELLKNVKSVAGMETEAEANLRRLFIRLNTDEASPLRGKLNVGDTSPGKLSRLSFDASLGRAQKSELLSKQPAEKQYELILNYLRAFQNEIEEKDQLAKRNFFGAMFDLFDEVLRKAKKELNSVKLPALQTVVSLFSDISETKYSGPAKRSASSKKCVIGCIVIQASTLKISDTSSRLRMTPTSSQSCQVPQRFDLAGRGRAAPIARPRSPISDRSARSRSTGSNIRARPRSDRPRPRSGMGGRVLPHPYAGHARRTPVWAVSISSSGPLWTMDQMWSICRLIGALFVFEDTIMESRLMRVPLRTRSNTTRRFARL